MYADSEFAEADLTGAPSIAHRTDVGLDPFTTSRITATVAASKAPATRRAYRSDWERFDRWCWRENHTALPAHPTVVAAYLVDASSLRTPAGVRAYSAATLSRWIASINHAHRTAGHGAVADHEMVRSTLSGIRRTMAVARERPTKRVAPLLVDDLRTILDAARRDVTGWAAQVTERRDSALLLMGFAGAFRRSELAGLTIGDVIRHPHDGLHVRLGMSKTDQDGRGAIRALPVTGSHQTCPPCAYVRWLDVVTAWDTGRRTQVIRALHSANDFDGHVCTLGRGRGACDRDVPVFRAIRKNGNFSTGALSGAGVHAVIRRRAEAAGYDEEFVARLGGHSLRAGFVTQAFRNGADAHAIMRQTGHANPAILETYAREHAPLIANAVTSIGL